MVRRLRPMSQRLGGAHIAAWNASTSNQDFAGTLAIVDNVPDTPTWVIVGVGPGRFTASPARSVQEVFGIGPADEEHDA